MALFSLSILPSPTSYHLLRRFSSPLSVGPSHIHVRNPIQSSKTFPQVCCTPRASLSASDPPSSDDEDPFQPSKELPEENPGNSPADPTIHSDASLNSWAVSSGPDLSFASSTPPVNNVAALQFDRDRQQEDLRKTLDKLSRSLELLSSSFVEISSAVRVLSATLGNNTQLQAASSPSGLRDAREAEAREVMSPPVAPPEPWDNAAAAKVMEGSGGPVDEVGRTSEEDTIPSYLVKQNERAHKLAYKLQQAFIQGRIEGLGLPFQVAAEDFVHACMEAYGLGIGLKELQLQLVLQDGSLTGAFAIRNQRWSDDPILNEESRIRSLWVRLVYTTLAQMTPTYTEDEEVDPVDAFVKEVLQLALEEGHVLERLKLEQAFSGSEIASGAIKALRENQYLILLTLEKAKPKSK